MYQLGWTTLPGLKGINVSEFRLTPTGAPDNERGVAMEFADECARRFTNAADAFDTVKAWTLERPGGMRGGLVS